MLSAVDAGSDGLLYSFLLELKPQQEAAVSPTHGYQAYSLVLQILRQQNPGFSQRLHELPGPKPFTVSPIRGTVRRRGAHYLLDPNEVYCLRLTVLDEEMFSRFLDAVINLPNDHTLRLESASLWLHRVVTTPGRDAGVGLSSFARLLEQAQPEPLIQLRFDSPTAFRSAGRRNVALPLPSLVFGSLLSRWNQFAPMRLPETLRQAVEDGVLVAGYRLETRMLDFGTYKEMGFQGDCAFECAPSMSPTQVCQLRALADFTAALAP